MSKQLKSNFFNRFDPNDKQNEEFTQGLRCLMALCANKEIWDRFVSEWPELMVPETNLHRRQAILDLAGEINISASELSDAFGVAKFLVKAFLTEGCYEDTPEDWAEDLCIHKTIDDEQKSDFVEIARCARKVLSQVEENLRKLAAIVGVFPVYSNISTTVGLKAVQKEMYDSRQQISEYTPAIESVVPVVSIRITATDLDSEEDTTLSFESRPASLRRMINFLQAALKDVETLQKLIGIGLDAGAES